MKVSFDGVNFICFCTFDERQTPKDAGFRWDPQARQWYTPSPGVAARLRKLCDASAEKELNRKILTIEPWTGGLSHSPNETLREFQKNAVEFALARNKSYLGLDPGLGKTACAAVIADTLNSKETWFVVYLCPPFLTRNTEAELARWTTRLKSIKRYNQKDDSVAQCMIVPDSVVNRDEVRKSLVNLTRFIQKTKGYKALLIVDEAHRFKNDSAGRTRALFGHKPKEGPREVGIIEPFDRVVFMSGTPMPNRPMELYPLLSHAAPETIENMNRFEYGRRYCAGVQHAFGWDFTGASNVPELAKRVIGTFMVRMKKDDVLRELPPKTEDMVLIGDDLQPKLAKLDSSILKTLSPEDLMHGRLSAESDDGRDLHLMTYRKELGIAKAPEAVKYVKALLEDSEESILIFAIHKEAISILEKGLESFGPLVITGETPMAKRHEIVKTFQDEKTGKRVFIGNIQAAGTGLTLTKATRVIFAEFSWVPADNDQASDRAHRIGQRDNVFVQYLVYKNSIDRQVIETVLRKKRVTERLV